MPVTTLCSGLPLFIYLNVVDGELITIEDIMFVKLLCQL